MTLLTFLGKGGQVIQLDSHEMRLQRAKRRLSAWAYACNCMAEARDKRVIGLLLTYSNVDDWRPDHINKFMDALKRIYGDWLLAYAWVLEWMPRLSGSEEGLPGRHYHVTLVLEPWVHLPYPDEAGYWEHGWTGLETRDKRGRLLRISAQYLSKYLQKGSEAGGFPKGARLFAVVIRCELDPIEAFYFKISAAVGPVRRRIIELLAVMNRASRSVRNYTGWSWERLPAGGWLVFHYGLHLVVEPEWVLVSTNEFYVKGEKVTIEPGDEQDEEYPDTIGA